MKELNHIERLVISKLLAEIKDESLQDILRDVIYGIRPLMEAIRYYRPAIKNPYQLFENNTKN